MKTFRLLLGLIMICALAGCEKHDILDIRTTYCTVLINGEEYKDAPTLREQLGRNGYPNSTKERIFIRKNQGNIAYLQFLLADNDDKKCYYLFGGIPFSEGESFPLLNKEYYLLPDGIETIEKEIEKRVEEISKPKLISPLLFVNST